MNTEIKRIGAEIASWTGCYNGFVANMASLMPPGKAIPSEVLDVMSEQEVVQAKAHLDQVYKGVIAAAKMDADAFVPRRDKWEAATAAYVKAENERVAVRTMHAKQDMERAEEARVKAHSFMPMKTPINR